MKAWFGYEATDDRIWEVCHRALVDGEPQEGWNELPIPSLYPLKHRELLRAIVSVQLFLAATHKKRRRGKSPASFYID